jgi:hypothetical protein
MYRTRHFLVTYCHVYCNLLICLYKDTFGVPPLSLYAQSVSASKSSVYKIRQHTKLGVESLGAFPFLVPLRPHSSLVGCAIRSYLSPVVAVDAIMEAVVVLREPLLYQWSGILYRLYTLKTPVQHATLLCFISVSKAQLPSPCPHSAALPRPLINLAYHLPTLQQA